MELYDFNAMSPHDRRRATYARGLCWRLTHWFFKHYRLTNELGEVVDGKEVFTSYLGKQAGALFVYKQYAEAEGVQGVPGCTLVTLQRQIEWCFEGKADCLDSFSVARRSVFKGLYYTGPEYHVQKNPAQFEFPILGKYNFLSKFGLFF